MEFFSINWWAVLVGTVLMMVTGGLWYNPKTFFNIWWKGIGKSEDDTPGGMSMALVWSLTIFASFVQTVGLGLMVKMLGPQILAASWLSGALIGFILWFFFVAPTYLVNKLFAGHGFTVWAIEIGNHLLNFVLIGVLFAIW